MRLLATLLLLLAAIYLHLGGVQADNKNILYYNNGQEPNITAYVNLLEELRSRLASKTVVHGITVTRPPTNIPLPERFIQAFPSTNYTYSRLGFNGRYGSLGNKEATELGYGALNDAIRNLFNEQSTSNSKKRTLLVIVQWFQKQYISMENKWSNLSEQVQWSGESGVFLWEIPVRSVSNEVVRIRNVVGVLHQAMLALTLYRCNPKAIRMPVPVAVGAEEQCLNGEPTTNIIRMDGQCVDVKDEQYNKVFTCLESSYLQDRIIIMIKQASWDHHIKNQYKRNKEDGFEP
nr:ribosome-inactivating protein [Tanacetum cinerariifolium]GEY04886.1 ribosome-inactivating protein [Tanacetum cinerariifolium]